LGGKIYKIEKRTRKINEIGKQKLETWAIDKKHTRILKSEQWKPEIAKAQN
jgi:hypothetical protein